MRKRLEISEVRDVTNQAAWIVSTGCCRSIPRRGWKAPPFRERRKVAAVQPQSCTHHVFLVLRRSSCPLYPLSPPALWKIYICIYIYIYIYTFNGIFHIKRSLDKDSLRSYRGTDIGVTKFFPRRGCTRCSIGRWKNLGLEEMRLHLVEAKKSKVHEILLYCVTLCYLFWLRVFLDVSCPVLFCFVSCFLFLYSWLVPSG